MNCFCSSRHSKQPDYTSKAAISMIDHSTVFIFNFFQRQVRENPTTPLERAPLNLWTCQVCKRFKKKKTNEDIARQSHEILRKFEWWRHKLGKFANTEALFPVVLTDFPSLVRVKSLKNRGRVHIGNWTKNIDQRQSQNSDVRSYRM